MDDVRWRVIEFASKTLSRAEEESYCVSRNEMRTLAFALKQFCVFLIGSYFCITSAHRVYTVMVTVTKTWKNRKIHGIVAQVMFLVFMVCAILVVAVIVCAAAAVMVCGHHCRTSDHWALEFFAKTLEPLTSNCKIPAFPFWSGFQVRMQHRSTQIVIASAA